jgi:DNA-binding transcriptional ArsR family regulator
MGKMGGTKKQILNMLKKKRGTLTDISDSLGLAPSTVSQHLKELVDSGEIRLADDQPRKWKYYEVSSARPQSPSDPRFQIRSIVIPIAGVILIAVLAIGLYLSGSGGVATAQQVYIAPGSAVPQGSTVFTISDSPQFYNISAIFITVTNASVRSDSGKWYRIPLQERTFNLVQLRNISKILSGVNLTSGSYDAVALWASNVSAIVNGTSEPVVLPSGKLTILGGFNISANMTNWVNIDFDLEKSVHITENGTIVLLPVLVVSHEIGSGIGLNSSSIIVARGAMPQRHEVFRCGMELNGSMMGNFSAPQNMTIGLRDGRPVEMGQGQNMLFLRSRGRIIVGGDARPFLMNNILTGNAINGTAWANGTAWINGTGWANGKAVGAGPNRPFIGGGYNGSGSYVAVNCSSSGRCHGLARGGGFNASAQWNASARSPNGVGAWVKLPPGLVGGNASGGYASCRFGHGSVDCDENESFNDTVPVGINPGGPCRGRC